MEACQTDSGAEFLTVAIYLDEAVPGNQNRPDRGRASQCLYWTIADYPAWFISRAAGWAPFAYVLLVEQKAAGVSDSLLVTMMAKAFTNELGSELDCDFAIVVGRCTFKFKMKMQVADWPQHSKTFNLKGHQGSLCCCWCSNCLGHCPEFDDDPMLVHYKSTQYHRFIPHTPESIMALVQNLEHTALHAPRQLKKLQQSTGFTYNPQGVLWDPEVMPKLILPYAAYTDWMHTFVASGGVAQFHMNQFVLVLEDHDIPAHVIDEWFLSAKVPHGFTQLKKTFFKDRVINKRGAHIRAFAGEMLTAIGLMHMFLQVVVVPLKIASLQDHIDCFTLLSCIISILLAADYNTIADLREATHTYHVLLKRLYPDICKPKVHAMQHVCDSLEFWRVLFNCFAPERKHKIMKSVMKFAYRKAPKTALAYAVRAWLAALSSEHAFAAAHSVGESFTVQPMQILLPPHGVATIFEWCPKLQLACGMICTGELLKYKTTHNYSGLGFAVGFAKLQVSSGCLFVAVIKVCEVVPEPINHVKHWRETGQYGMLTSGQIQGCVVWADFGQSFVPGL